MKRIYLIVLTALLLVPVYGQQNIGKTVPEDIRVSRENDRVFMDLNLNINNLDLKSQEMIYLTPVLISADNTTTFRFEPVVVVGAKRDRALNRAIGFEDFIFDPVPQQIIRYSKNSNQLVPLALSIPNQEWLYNARLVLEESITGCVCEEGDKGMLTLLTLPAPPQYVVAYITPPAEAVKQRSETHSARINFQVGKYEILPHFKNNGEVLGEVEKIMNEVRNDANLTVREIQITGYASPEGNGQSNMTLSKNRAESFANYLAGHYGFQRSIIRTDWKGEDWEGLKSAVTSGNMGDRQQVLDILNNEQNINARKNRLKQLSGGRTYRSMLQDIYPPLRRNDYTISYVSRNFTVDEARQVIKTKPQHLSQNEMYLVANSYPRNSREFKEAFDAVARYYPNDQVAQLNLAAYEIEHGSVDKAIQMLLPINTPEAWNNLGVAYYKKQEYARSREFFNRAAQAGLQQAISNVEQTTGSIQL